MPFVFGKPQLGSANKGGLVPRQCRLTSACAPHSTCRGQGREGGEVARGGWNVTSERRLDEMA